jgi:hypothetical protein
MIILRPTRKATARLGIAFHPAPGATTSKLGDWYVNLVPTIAGELFVFVSAATLLAVAIPAGEKDVQKLFVLRVANLLTMIGVPVKAIEGELQHFHDLRFAKPLSRSIQGSANDIAFHIQRIAEDACPGAPLSLSQAEMYLAEIPHSPLGFASPLHVAAEILGAPGMPA